MKYHDWSDFDDSEAGLKSFFDAFFEASGIDPATVPERIEKESQGVFIPDKNAISRLHTIYNHIKTAFAGSKSCVSIISNDGTFLHHCYIYVRCDMLVMNHQQASEFFNACRISRSVDILPDNPEMSPAEDGFSFTIRLFADKAYEPDELDEPEPDIESICESIQSAELEPLLSEYADYNPDDNEIEICAVELDFLTSTSPVMEALRSAKKLLCNTDDDKVIITIGF